MVKFVTDIFSEEEANVVVLSCKAPASLREVSQLVEPFDIDRQKNLLENVRIFDSGEISIDDVNKKIVGMLGKQRFFLLLGDEHTVTLHAAKALPKGTKLIVFDAHADLKDEYEGSKFSHACWLRRLCESFACKDVALIGLRSCDEDELDFMKENGILHFTANQVKDDLEGAKKRLGEFVGDSKAYVSIDMDVFDPSIAPAVKYPEPEGLNYREFLELTATFAENKLIGLDLVEIKPIAGNRITEFLAVKVLFELLSKIDR